MIAHTASASASAPAAAPLYRLQQAIFHGVAAADGARVVFASLTDGRCALLLDDRLVAAWGNDDYGIKVGVGEYLEMTGATPQCTAARARLWLRSRMKSQMKQRRRPGVTGPVTQGRLRSSRLLKDGFQC